MTITRLQKHYENITRPDLVSSFMYKNPMEIPKLEKISIHMMLKQAIHDKKHIETALFALELITGQKATYVYAKKSISSFQLRKGMIIGCRVTLRKDRMYSFLDNLVTTVLPRLRDFHGLSSKSFDGAGNYSFGLKDCLVFPEIEAHYDLFDQTYGMDIHIVTSAKTNKEAQILLSSLQFPFQ